MPKATYLPEVMGAQHAEGSPAQVVGDSRDGDETLLQRHPQCREHHAAWTAAPAPGPADDDTHRR